MKIPPRVRALQKILKILANKSQDDYSETEIIQRMGWSFNTHIEQLRELLDVMSEHSLAKMVAYSPRGQLWKATSEGATFIRKRGGFVREYRRDRRKESLKAFGKFLNLPVVTGIVTALLTAAIPIIYSTNKLKETLQ